MVDVHYWVIGFLSDGESSAIGHNAEVNEVIKWVIVVFKIIMN